MTAKPRSGSRITASPEGKTATAEAPLAAYSVNRIKAWGFVLSLAALLAFSLWRLVVEGLANSEALMAMGILLAAASVMSWWVLRDLRYEGPILILERKGLRDLRRGGALIAWEDIAEVAFKRRGVMTGKGIRLQLKDGQRMDIEMYLMKGSPQEAVAIIDREMRRVAGKRRAK